jgi:hypothetical protein
MPLRVGVKADPVAGQRLAEQRELTAGRVDDVDADVAMVLHNRIDPLYQQLVGRRGHHQPVPADT